MSHTFFSVLKLNFQERLSSMLQEVQEYTKLCHEDSEKELAEQQKIVEKYKRKWHFLTWLNNKRLWKNTNENDIS